MPGPDVVLGDPTFRRSVVFGNPLTDEDPASGSHLDLNHAPCVVYGVADIDPVSLAPFVGRGGQARRTQWADPTGNHTPELQAAAEAAQVARALSVALGVMSCAVMCCTIRVASC